LRYPVARKLALAFAALMTAAISSIAQAAPYCLAIPGVPPQCLYTDARDCFRQAARQHANCSVNAAEIRLPAGATDRFCLVQNGPVVDCSYADRRSCDARAPALGGICVDRTPSQPDVDLFAR